MDFIVVSLSAKIEELNNKADGLNKLKEALLSFCCAKNHDEQDFLRKCAIDFEINNKARTYLIIYENRIIAYFSLAIKSIDLANLTNSKKKEITSGEISYDAISAYLIGHLAKSDDCPFDNMGNVLLDLSFDLIRESQRIVGGRLTYLDCVNDEHIIKIYEEYGFKYFQTSNFTGLRQYYKKI
jgi:hypothetical protein